MNMMNDPNLHKLKVEKQCLYAVLHFTSSVCNN